MTSSVIYYSTHPGKCNLFVKITANLTCFTTDNECSVNAKYRHYHMIPGRGFNFQPEALELHFSHWSRLGVKMSIFLTLEFTASYFNSNLPTHFNVVFDIISGYFLLPFYISDSNLRNSASVLRAFRDWLLRRFSCVFERKITLKLLYSLTLFTIHCANIFLRYALP